MSATSRDRDSFVNPKLHPQRRSKPPNRNQIFESSQLPRDPVVKQGSVTEIRNSRDELPRVSLTDEPSPPRGSITKYKTAAEETVDHLIWNQAGLSQQTQHYDDKMRSDMDSSPPNRAQMVQPSESRVKGLHGNKEQTRGRGGIVDTMGSLSVIRNFSGDHGWNEAPFSLPSRPMPPKKPGSGQRVTLAQLGFSFGSILALIQSGLILLYALFVVYDGEQVTSKPAHAHDPNVASSTATREVQEFHATDKSRLLNFYPLFEDVHVMIFVGFGFLMTFLRKYGYSALGYNMLIGALAIQWSIVCRGFFHHGLGTNEINIESLINGDFAAGTVLITFGAIIGVASPHQLIFVCAVEVTLYCLNEYIGAELLQAIDIGGSMWIHTFGAYFGLALSLTMRRQKDIDTKNEGASYSSDMFAMVGTLFLWMFWPSFNGAMAQGDDQHRAVLNTVLSLTASCVFSFAASSLMSPGNKFSMVHVQNASLAGGVAVGAVADLMIRPYGALLIGSFAGLLSTAGYVYLTPLLQRTIGLHDTCGVHNLHGMPGVMAGLVGVIMAAIASEADYGMSLYLQYPARAPVENSSFLSQINNENLSSVKGGLDRTAQEQALYQLAALVITLTIAIVGGAVTGLVLRMSFFGRVPNEYLFNDSQHWELEEEEAEGHSGHSASPTPNLGAHTTNGSYGTLGVTNPGMEMRQEKGAVDKDL